MIPGECTSCPGDGSHFTHCMAYLFGGISIEYIQLDDADPNTTLLLLNLVTGMAVTQNRFSLGVDSSLLGLPTY